MNELIIIALCLSWTLLYFYKSNKKKFNASIDSLKQEVVSLTESSLKDKQYIETQRLDFSNTVNHLKQSIKEESIFPNKKN